MVQHIEIRNYRSVREIQLTPRRVNLFIGEHNSGKSNILEALTWFSRGNISIRGWYNELFRFNNPSELFFDFNTSIPIEIVSNEYQFSLHYNGGLFEGRLKQSKEGESFVKEVFQFDITHEGSLINTHGQADTNFRAYVFRKPFEFILSGDQYLNPPYGDNIPSLLLSNRSLKEMVSSIFREKGFRLMLKPVENEVAMAKDVNDELYSYPYKSVSETLQRIIFYQLAIESNKDAVLIMDEPESNTFPMYTKQLGELMALDQQNQYFIATHNPYLLGAIVAKTPVTELNVYVTKMENYKTVVYPVSAEKLAEMQEQGVDVFFNLDNLTMLS